jgi:hypothetical protein
MSNWSPGNELDMLKPHMFKRPIQRSMKQRLLYEEQIEFCWNQEG